MAASSAQPRCPKTLDELPLNEVTLDAPDDDAYDLDIALATGTST